MEPEKFHITSSFVGPGSKIFSTNAAMVDYNKDSKDSYHKVTKTASMRSFASAPMMPESSVNEIIPDYRHGLNKNKSQYFGGKVAVTGMRQSGNFKPNQCSQKLNIQRGPSFSGISQVMTPSQSDELIKAGHA